MAFSLVEHINSLRNVGTVPTHQTAVLHIEERCDLQIRRKENLIFRTAVTILSLHQNTETKRCSKE
jgi:hypothetical protein